MLEINILDDAQRFLSALPERFEHQIVQKIILLAQNPMHPRSKLLEGYAPLRRFRSGDYRIVYFVDGNVLKIPLIDKRGDDRAYRRLAQKFKRS